MKQLESIFFSDRQSFRDWLIMNHEISPGIWMLFYKKQTGIKCLNYTDALEEALCFGWIDSLIKKIDDERYARKFTPRTDTAKWSEINRRLVATLSEKGLMTDAGIRKADFLMKTENQVLVKKITAKDKKELVMPDFILNTLAENEPALTNFNNLALTYKRHFIGWITAAKREETVRNRLKEAVILLKEGQKLGLK